MQKIIRGLVRNNSSKIIFVVLDGLGGIPLNGETELQSAHTPNMDALARTSACGLHLPVGWGITPGSGPGHLALFGYEPKEYQIGRGILEAVGLGMDIRKTDVALRCNYATIENGLIRDRRAGRIPTAQSSKITERLQSVICKIGDVEVSFAPGMEHRFAVRFRFPADLTPDAAAINDTDPQKEGLAPIPPEGKSPASEKVAAVAAAFIDLVARELKDQPIANYALMRGFSVMPHLTAFEDAYGLKALAVAVYPMYRGIATLIGMQAPAIKGDVPDEVAFIKENYDRYDFFFMHVKKVDSYGEDGNFAEKRRRIEEFDALLPAIMDLKPDVLVITGDHSTPAVMKEHSWHPVPVLLHSPYVLGGLCSSFSERECLRGELGILPTVNLMPLVLANSLRLKKFGA